MTDTLEPRTMQANGLEFAYLERGQGPLALCLHGFPDTAWSFVPLLEALAAAGYRGVAPFLRGYPPSGVPADGDYRATTLGRDVLALVEHFGADRAFAVGHDWGAVAAYVAATLRPDRFRAVVAAGMPHLRRFLQPTLRQLRRSRYMGFFQLRGMPERRIVEDHFRWLEALIREWSPSWRFSADDLEPVKAALRDPQRLQALLGYYRALPRSLLQAESWRLLRSKLQVPVLTISGSEDGCIGPEMFTRQRALFAADYELVEMHGAGHFMHREQPAQFQRLVVGFLDRYR